MTGVMAVSSLFDGTPNSGIEVGTLVAEIVRVQPDEPQPDRIDYIVSCLCKGDVVALPTDTFYGLAVDPVNLHAVERIYQIKTRQKFKPLSLLIASLAQAYELVRDADSAPMLTSWRSVLARSAPPSLWRPAPACRCAPRRIPAMLPLRVPKAAIPRAVVERFGLPITATAANLQGRPNVRTTAPASATQIGDLVP